MDKIYKIIFSKSISERVLKYRKNYLLRFFLIGLLSGVVYIVTNEIKLPIVLLVLLDFYIVDLYTTRYMYPAIFFRGLYKENEKDEEYEKRFF
jgi:hypothetical protein